MATIQNDSGFASFTATAAAIALGARVKLNTAREILVAGATDIAIGVTVAPVAASGIGTVKLFNAPGTFIMIASAAIAAGAQLYPTAAGKVDDTGTTALPLVAVQAAAADGDLIECAPGLKGA